jgi:hypothetical protein
MALGSGATGDIRAGSVACPDTSLKIKTQVRRILAIRVTKNAVDQPIKIMPLIPSIAETRRHLSAIAASL